MRDNFFLLEIAEGSVAGMIAFPLARIIGSNPGFTLVLVLSIAMVPGLIIAPFATDFASGTHYSPNRAARALRVAEFIRGSLFVWSISSMLMLPVGWMLGLEARQLALFMLFAGATLCFVMEFAMSWIHRRNGAKKRLD